MPSLAKNKRTVERLVRHERAQGIHKHAGAAAQHGLARGVNVEDHGFAATGSHDDKGVFAGGKGIDAPTSGRGAGERTRCTRG